MDHSILTQLSQATANYQMPTVAAELLKSNPPLILSGITAAGKSTIAGYILEAGKHRWVITHTTRAMRPSEQPGREYYFVSQSEMLQMLQVQAFIEVKMVHGDTAYGTSIQAYKYALDSGKQPLMDIDVQGTSEIARRVHDLRALFILPPSLEVWLERLGRRGAMSHVERSRRFASATAEIQAALDSHNYILITNHEAHAAAAQIINGQFPAHEQHDSRVLAQQLIGGIRQL